MGTGARHKPLRLAEKLRRIRTALGLSQSEMVKRLGADGVITYTKISHYELGKREPPLMILLAYARVANVAVEVLIDDDLNLPDKVTDAPKREAVKRGPVSPKVKRPTMQK